jgi:hypothetical protein
MKHKLDGGIGNPLQLQRNKNPEMHVYLGIMHQVSKRECTTQGKVLCKKSAVNRELLNFTGKSCHGPASVGNTFLRGLQRK